MSALPLLAAAATARRAGGVVAALPLSGDLYDETTAIFAALLTARLLGRPPTPTCAARSPDSCSCWSPSAWASRPTASPRTSSSWRDLRAVWVGGRLVRANKQTADAMADRAELAEREREERARAAVAEERARIARELHDVVAHSISVMVVQAGAERRALGDERAETREVLRRSRRPAARTLAEMRRLLGMLRRSDDELELAPQPSMEHVDALIAQVREAGLPVTLSVEGDAAPLPAGVDLSAYRIVQEALTNALKHAGPRQARVTVRYGRDELELEIVDDGAGRRGERRRRRARPDRHARARDAVRRRPGRGRAATAATPCARGCRSAR